MITLVRSYFQTFAIQFINIETQKQQGFACFFVETGIFETNRFLKAFHMFISIVFESYVIRPKKFSSSLE